MKNKTDESTPIFLICIGLYFIIGLFAKFTDVLKGPIRWYHIVIIAPIGILGIIMQIYPYYYIKAKLKEWGMFENKADSIAAGFWIGCLILWYFIFMLDQSMD
jgi:hypothetical protein